MSKPLGQARRARSEAVAGRLSGRLRRIAPGRVSRFESIDAAEPMLLSLLRRFSQTRVGRTLLVAAVGSLLAAQQASLLHSLGHLAASGQALAAHAPATGLGADPSKPADADVHCDKCFQLSQVAGYLFGGPAAAVLAPAGQEVPRLLAIAGRSVDPLGPRSRGPPAVL